MHLRSMALGLMFAASAASANAADETYHAIDVPLFVCKDPSQAIKLAHLALNEEKMRAFTLADDSGCSQWKTPATYRLVPNTAGNGIVRVQIDKDNMVGANEGLGWTTQQQIYFANGKRTDLTFLQKSFLACNTLEGAKQNIPSSIRAANAGIAVIGASDGTKAHPTQNYACSRVEPGIYAIGLRDSENSGYVRYRLMDTKNSEVWMISFWK